MGTTTEGRSKVTGVIQFWAGKLLNWHCSDGISHGDMRLSWRYVELEEEGADGRTLRVISMKPLEEPEEEPEGGAPGGVEGKPGE